MPDIPEHHEWIVKAQYTLMGASMIHIVGSAVNEERANGVVALQQARLGSHWRIWKEIK